MEHSIESYLKRLSTPELESMLQYFFYSRENYAFEICEVLKELARRKT